MDDRVAEYMRDRTAERVWLHYDETPLASFDGVAEAVGIKPLGRAWVEIDEWHAEEILAKLLRVDLAYGTERMPEHRARWLAREFIGGGSGWSARFATNTDGDPCANGRSWAPATDFTFDRGIVVLSSSGVACYWVADEV